MSGVYQQGRGRQSGGEHRLILFALALANPLVACSSGESSPTATGSEIIVTQVSLPVPGTVYRGEDSHHFLDESVTLFCGTHGVFTNSVQPPNEVGESVSSDYLATFVGELVLQPPVSESVVTHTLTAQARMAERITLRETRGSTQTFDTELVTFELGGTDMPANIVVRESADFVSAGITTITAVSGGRNRVESHYDVWLEVSLDGGRTWNRAQNAVRMSLQPG